MPRITPVGDAITPARRDHRVGAIRVDRLRCGNRHLCVDDLQAHRIIGIEAHRIGSQVFLKAYLCADRPCVRARGIAAIDRKCWVCRRVTSRAMFQEAPTQHLLAILAIGGHAGGQGAAGDAIDADVERRTGNRRGTQP